MEKEEIREKELMSQVEMVKRKSLDLAIIARERVTQQGFAGLGQMCSVEHVNRWGMWKKCAKTKVDKCSKLTKHKFLKKHIKMKKNYLLLPVFQLAVAEEHGWWIVAVQIT